MRSFRRRRVWDALYDMVAGFSAVLTVHTLRQQKPVTPAPKRTATTYFVPTARLGEMFPNT